MVAIAPIKTDHFTFKAINLMGRASFNLGALMGMEETRSGPFKLFAEAAVLGVQNQPLYYEKIEKRIPVMAGIDIPTFGILNLLSLQMEYLKNDLPDNTYQQFQEALPQPSFTGNNIASYMNEKAAGNYKADDIKWTVFVHKALTPGLDLFAQAANDHFRVQNVTAEPSYVPVTHKKGDWYYMFRFQWAM